ncbi:MAG TPA: S9 family peptidase [Candidatus Limnocylindrales bacterium]|nr:S9 family peptidase [Candidatus Limnocylindrales bacterium]
MISRGNFRAAAVALALMSAILWPGVRAAQGQESGASATPSQKRNLQIDDYFRIKDVADPQISPEGKWVAYVVHTHDLNEDKNESRIWMVATAGGEAIPLTAEKVSSSHPRWSPDGKYLAFLSERDEGKTQVWLLNRKGGEAQRLTDTIQDVNDFAWSPSSDRLVLVLQDPTPDEIEAAKHKDDDSKAKEKPRPWVIDRLHFKEDEIGYLDRRRTHLYVFGVADRKMRQVTSGDYDDSAPAWSPDGKSIAFVSNRSADPDRNFNDDIWVVAADNTDEGKTLVQVTTNPGTDGAPAWSPDGKWIAFTSQLDPKLFQYATFQLALAASSGGEEKVLTRALDRNVSSPHFSADGRYIYFIADDDGTQNVLRIPASGGEMTRPIGGRLMVDAYTVSSSGAIAAQIGMLDRPDEIYLRAADGGELRRLTTTNDALVAEIRMPSVEYVHFKSKDGTTVAGYLYKPPDYKPGMKYPAILRPHGGPVWAYYAEFNFLPQLYAANGYVVLTPNPRGSSGYGQDFCKAIYADWGNKDFQDDMAMVDYAVEQGLADPERLGVGGHSYGAISTNFIITQTARFKAAISNAGEFLYSTNWGHDEYVREWEIELGLPWENRALWEKLSPFNRVTKITTPTLIEGGNVDWNVPIINGEQMYESLKRLGVPTLLVVYPGEYHEFRRPSFIKDLYERDLAWFSHYVKGEGPAIPSQKAAH